MTAERFRQIRNVFEAATERDESSRVAYLEDACAGDAELRDEVQRLLRRHAVPSSQIDTPAAELLWPDGTANRREGRVIGAWEMLREIGRGGMAIVFLARRADGAFQKQAAVKILRTGFPDADLLERFRQEREILARLDHPSIARLLDGGTTPDGSPYLVMEYVEGEPITAWADHKVLDVAARLRLFQQLCRAVQYLHENGIVHRDLKPSNILVTSAGTVKLLDLGIAKLLETQQDQTVLLTRAGLQFLTPEYASPEQVRGEHITPQTDIYALGVILYELLTGRRPYRMHSRIMHEVVRAICEEQPEKPSTAVTRPETRLSGDDVEPITTSRRRGTSPDQLSRALKGQLDDIVLKAMRKAPQHRYRSAEQFASDIGAHLEQRPVVAHGSSAIEGLVRMPAPYRAVGAVLFVVIVLVASGAVTVHASALLYGGVAALVLALCWAAVDPKIGRRLAQSNLVGKPARMILVMIALGVVVALVPAMYGNEVFAATYAAIAVYAAVRTLHWYTRGRWAGRLVLDASGVPHRTLIAMVLAASAGSSFHGFKENPRDLVNWVQISSYVVAIVCISVLQRKLEFRERGIVHMGRMVPWEDIESWSWDVPEGTPLSLFRNYGAEEMLLKVQRRSGIQFLPPVEFRVPPSMEDDVTRVMNKYLSDWPQA